MCSACDTLFSYTLSRAPVLLLRTHRATEKEPSAMCTLWTVSSDNVLQKCTPSSVTQLPVCRVHVDQRSFPMTEEQYLDKLDGIAMLMNVWNRQTQVRTFFKEPAKPKNGMPARPIVGTAVALQLDLPPEQVQEWLGSRLG
jgi:hypothetical protein